MENLEILIYGIPALLVVMGLTQIVKRVGLPDKFAPLVSMGLGITLMLLGNGLSFWGQSIVQGIVLGLTTSGLWSGYKATILNQ